MPMTAVIVALFVGVIVGFCAAALCQMARDE